MADKEERIEITIDDRYCENYCKSFPLCCSHSCEHIDKPYVRYTRQEAIEVMARALCKVELNCKCVCDIKCGAWKIETKQAEAALNALLEGVKK